MKSVTCGTKFYYPILKQGLMCVRMLCIGDIQSESACMLFLFQIYILLLVCISLPYW